MAGGMERLKGVWELMDFILDSAWGGKYLQMNTDDDKFPILIRRDSYPGIVRPLSLSWYECRN